MKENSGNEKLLSRFELSKHTFRPPRSPICLHSPKVLNLSTPMSKPNVTKQALSQVLKKRNQSLKSLSKASERIGQLNYIERLWPPQLRRKLRLQNFPEERRKRGVSYSSSTSKQSSFRRSRSQDKCLLSSRPKKKPLDYYVEKKHQRKTSQEYYSDHLEATFKALKDVRKLPPVPQKLIQASVLDLPKVDSKKTVVFDLDETLVHCCDEGEKADAVIPIQLPNNETVNAGIRIRPFTIECLSKAKELFEVIVFTASHQCYADTILDFLDPNKTLIDHRLYRNHCIVHAGMYIKDLRILAHRNLKNIVIVDNLAQNYAQQLNNGIPIISWYDDREDKELLNLISYLKKLAAVDDVREMNRETFRLESFYEDYLQFKNKN